MILKRLVFHSLLVLALCLGGGQAWAQSSQQKLVIGGGKLNISQEQKLMFEAAKKAVARQFKDAETMYSQVIAMNNQFTDAYLQRGVVRRELGDIAGAQADGQNVIALADAAVQKNPGDAFAYYQRGMGYRLLRQYPEAKHDVQKALSLGGSPDWETDLRDIGLEEKARH